MTDSRPGYDEARRALVAGLAFGLPLGVSCAPLIDAFEAAVAADRDAEIKRLTREIAESICERLRAKFGDES